MQTANDPRIIVALDFPSQKPALTRVDQLDRPHRATDDAPYFSLLLLPGERPR